MKAFRRVFAFSLLLLAVPLAAAEETERDTDLAPRLADQQVLNEGRCVAALTTYLQMAWKGMSVKAPVVSGLVARYGACDALRIMRGSEANPVDGRFGPLPP